jgi:hypothetical protein
MDGSQGKDQVPDSRDRISELVRPNSSGGAAWNCNHGRSPRRPYTLLLVDRIRSRHEGRSGGSRHRRHSIHRARWESCDVSEPGAGRFRQTSMWGTASGTKARCRARSRAGVVLGSWRRCMRHLCSRGDGQPQWIGSSRECYFRFGQRSSCPAAPTRRSPSRGECQATWAVLTIGVYNRPMSRMRVAAEGSVGPRQP